MFKTITILFTCLALFGASNIFAQQPAYTYYSIREGLPTNDIYNCVVDKKGFLWVATENGVSRFDGKNFKNYTIAQGLPDNDILSVNIDNEGVIWVMPFQRTPAHYDPISDKFISGKTNLELKKIALSYISYCNPLENGGISFININGQIFIYKNKKCFNFYVKNKNNLGSTRVIDLSNEKYMVVSSDSLRIFKNMLPIKSVALNYNVGRTAFANNQLYIADSTKLVKLQILPDGNVGKKIEQILPFAISNIFFTNKQIAITSASGNIYFADTATLNMSQQSFSFNAMVNYVYEDKYENTWICTKENGLIRYQQKGILTISDEPFQRNFNTLCFNGNQLAAGTNNGQVYLYNAPYDYKIISIAKDKNYSGWVRQIVATKNRLLVAQEGALVLINKQNKVLDILNKKKNYVNKDFILLNDSTLITGNSSFVAKVNWLTLKKNDSANIRVTALAAQSDTNIYVGSNTGLYYWKNYKKLINFGNIYPILSNRVSSLAYNKLDEILWVGLASDTLVVLKNNAPIAKIALGAKLLGNNCRSIFANKKGEIWVGTNLALGRVRYQYQNSKFEYKIDMFTTADGIAAKQINDIAEKNDTIYVATTSGISIIPSNININVPDIDIFITAVKLNNKDTALQNVFNLDYKHNNISISFSAADLATTADRVYEYRINNGLWAQTLLDNLPLPQLAAGKYRIQIRALNRDGNPSKKVAEITFNIVAPFWKTGFFWIVIALMGGALIYYLTEKRNSIKREQSIQVLLTQKKLSDLELKALKAQINPHFVFNCLNSIKFLNHQKRFIETDLYLDKFSYLLRKTLDFSGIQKISLQDELEYSKNYLELEKLRLGNSLHYNIVVNENINTKEILVPPMLLQPFLENAIKHGIRHLPNNDGEIIIEASIQNSNIILTINDNGVGLNKSKKINELENPNHLSQGTTLQQRRANLYNIDVQYQQAKNKIGTLVILTFKLEENI